MEDESAEAEDALAMSVSTEEPMRLRKVTDHGLSVSLKLPRIPCSKYTVIGDPKMRVKRGARHEDSSRRHIWKVPTRIQAALATKTLTDIAPHQYPEPTGKISARTKATRTNHVRQKKCNILDSVSLYAAKSEDSFKGIDDAHPRRKVRVENDQVKTERKFIERFYRQRSSALLSPIQRRHPSRTLSISLPSVLQGSPGDNADSTTFGGVMKDTWTSMIQLDRYHTRECLYCDIAGQKYCSECRRRHQQLKFKESIGPDFGPAPTLVRLPSPDSCRVQRKPKVVSHVSLQPDRNAMTLSPPRGRHRRYRNKDWSSSTLFYEPPPHLRNKEERKKAKVKALKLLPRVDLPDSSDITNDNDNRHL